MGGKPRIKSDDEMTAFLNQIKTCPHCGETWNDCLVDHTCKSLLGTARFLIDREAQRPSTPATGSNWATYSARSSIRFARTLLEIEKLCREHDPFTGVDELASMILTVLEEG